MVGAPPALPPYAHVTREATQCIAEASRRYDVPELLLHAILIRENGRMGQYSRNKNGSYDLGLAQINTAWLPHFHKYGIRLEHLLYDTCTNLQASAYILRDNYNKKGGNWYYAIMAYNIGPYNWTEPRYRIGYQYAYNVVRTWWGFYQWLQANQAANLGIKATPAPAQGQAPTGPQPGPTASLVATP